MDSSLYCGITVRINRHKENPMQSLIYPDPDVIYLRNALSLVTARLAQGSWSKRQVTVEYGDVLGTSDKNKVMADGNNGKAVFRDGHVDQVKQSSEPVTISNACGTAVLSTSAGDRRPFLIGVAGGTASGKSSVCQKIIEALDQNGVNKLTRRRVEVISQDCFYRPLTDAEKQQAAKREFDFDHPDAFDEDMIIQTLNNIMSGKAVNVTEYDYINNCLDAKRTRTIEPADVILFEGILVFYFEKVRKMFNMKIFVDTDADTRLARRVERDMKVHERPLDQILHQYMLFVKRDFEEFCVPTKKFADIIIPRGADNIVAIDLIVQHIQDLLQNGSTLPDVTHSPRASGASLHHTDSASSFKTFEDQKYSPVH